MDKLKENALNEINTLLDAQDYTIDQLSQIIWLMKNIKNDRSKITCKENDE